LYIIISTTRQVIFISNGGKIPHCRYEYSTALFAGPTGYKHCRAAVGADKAAAWILITPVPSTL
jgi:hypothetical protein